MRRKEVFYAVIDGVVGAVLVMTAGSFTPLGAQNEVMDAKYDSITCRRIWLEGLNGEICGDNGVVYVFGEGAVGAIMRVNEHDGQVIIAGQDKKAKVGLAVDEYGGRVDMFGYGDKKESQVDASGNECR